MSSANVQRIAGALTAAMDLSPIPEAERQAWAEAAVTAVLEAIRAPSDDLGIIGGAALARQFTNPYGPLTPEEERAFGLEVGGPDGGMSADRRLAGHVGQAFTAMVDKLISDWR